MKTNKSFSPEKKDRIKVIRSIFQIFILSITLTLIVKVLFFPPEFEPTTENNKVQTEQGFIAISYFGVDRSEEESLIDTKRLEEHLQALANSGYQTITQQDILDYYEKGTSLPEKSLFLIFEDGRRDTAIFSQKIMEKFNFKATILTYAQNLEMQDPKFLTTKDIKELEKSSFWELGSNGYRLAYINVFDRHNNFLDAMNTYEFQMISSYLDRNYNHYLMDYIRDESGIPTENLQQMQKRISFDYDKMRKVYEEEIGNVPDMYILMHSNTGQFGTNEKVSIENEKQIDELFSMNFNREGDSRNIQNSSLYDLTRMQPQAYWHTNHLLMRIKDDTNMDVAFVSGDTDKKAKWETRSGESEFVEDKIILTSPPREEGLMILKDSETFQDVNLAVTLEGNKLGTQSIYLRMDAEKQESLRVEIKNNHLVIYDTANRQSLESIFALDLDEHDGIIKESVEENKHNAEIRELETQLRYTDSVDEARVLNQLLNDKRNQKPLTVEEGGTVYTPEIGISEPGSRFVEISLHGDLLTVSIDNEIAVQDLQVENTNSGNVALGVSPVEGGYSQRNLYDDVYDGVFENLVVSNDNYSDEEKIMYDNRLQGFEKIEHTVKTRWNQLINWFIRTL